MDDLEAAHNTLLEYSLRNDGDLRSSKIPFTWKLHSMLEDAESSGNEHIVSWVDSGRAFKVHDLDEFVGKVIPFYFRQSKWKSFQRQLYFYGYTRTKAGAYQHPKFVKGRKALSLSMKPTKIRQTQAEKDRDCRDRPMNDSDRNRWPEEASDLRTKFDTSFGNGLNDRSTSGPFELSDGERVSVFGDRCFHYVFDNSRYV
eukprot:scaffold5247_cov130-Cylindrotheca_fusiformis.AAC.10